MVHDPRLPLAALGGASITVEFENHDMTPLLFVCRAQDGDLYLCVCQSEVGDGLRWLCVLISDATCLRLTRGDITFREGFTDDESALCLEIDTDAGETRPLRVRDVPGEWLPAPGERAK